MSASAPSNGHDAMEPIAVRISTAVQLTGICRSTIYELIGDGTIETVKIGRSTFILYPSLKRLFERS
ncbi:helix-turn-helix domain-containing protein [Sphingomonas qomolangmaensis]|uniref:Helix-turn-helix domain-containing protein n=1 Tax=Sphingomonas qomolangmaensis TaxID=2918765 RepID=A0ABY5L6K7_9SPHN|nr:helix-turn-helix domain-containing protein [Sphingomonas qomolangmaensis]UUL82595.1 helix-turn-helix domain-containing protein [Sphingomonas qomolangmaensis]